MRLIDADELKKHTVKVCFHNAPECGKFDAVVVYEIDIMPTIDPESLRPTAHWIIKDSFYRDSIVLCCSACKRNFVLYGGTPKNENYQYCPACGKRMVNTDD